MFILLFLVCSPLPFIVVNKKRLAKLIIGFLKFFRKSFRVFKVLKVIGYAEELMDMPSVSPQHVTQLLSDWSHGDDAALAELTPLVYEELRRLAHHFMEGQRPEHTLQTTALVNEAYLRLVITRAWSGRTGLTFSRCLRR